MKKLLALLLCVLFPASLDHAQVAAPLSAEPFARLLYRLDHAPVNLDAAAQSSQRGSRMQQAASGFSQTAAPLTPLLKNLARSRPLSVMSRVPLAGRPARGAQDALNGVASLNHNLARLVELDKAQVQPLRKASITAAHLRRMRNRRELPAAVLAFQAANHLLQDDEHLVQQQRQKLTRTATTLQVLLSYLQRYGRVPGQDSQRWRSLRERLHTVQHALDERLMQLSVLRRFTNVSLNDAQASHHHAQIAYDGRDYNLTDCNSTNGTWLNGRRVRCASLCEGDTLYIG